MRGRPAARAMARPTPALVRVCPVHLCHDPSGEPLARPRVARRHGSRTALVPRALAQPARRRRALQRLPRSHRDGALVDLRAAHLADARMGGRPALPRAHDPRAARPPRRGHTHGQSAVWPGRSLRSRGAQPLAPPGPISACARASSLLVAWTHGCIGIHFWLRLRPWYPRVRPPLFGTAVLLPVLALLGFVNAGRIAAALAREPGGAARLLQQTIGPAQVAALERVEWTIYLDVPGRPRPRPARARGPPRPRAPAGARSGSATRRRGGRRPVALPSSRRAARRASPTRRCAAGAGAARRAAPRSSRGSRPSPPERRRGAGARAHGRAAGRPARLPVAPAGRRGVRPLVSTTTRAGPDLLRRCARGAVAKSPCSSPTSASSPRWRSRGCRTTSCSSSTTTSRLGRAIEQAGGVTNQFTGDGVMALFGVDTDPARGCRQALLGARAMARSVAALSRSMADDLDEPLRIGIGIHTGPAVVGQMATAKPSYLTAVGDTVHVGQPLPGPHEALPGPAHHLRESRRPGRRRRLRVPAPRDHRAQPPRDPRHPRHPRRCRPRRSGPRAPRRLTSRQRKQTGPSVV